jgi:large subunit ribosomal protein L13
MHPGGIKRAPMRHVFEKDATDPIRRAVYGMLPKNRQRDELMKRLTILA